MIYRNLISVVLLVLLFSCSREEPGKDQTSPFSPQKQVVTATEAVPAAHDAGRNLFEYWCLPCHGAGPGYAGTMALAQRLGEEQSVILDRDNLPAEYIKFVVRNGLQMMPPLMPTEITDEGLELLAEYLASAGKPDS